MENPQRGFLLPLMDSLFCERAGDRPITCKIAAQSVKFSGTLDADFQIPVDPHINAKFRNGFLRMGAQLSNERQIDSVIKYHVYLNVEGEVPMQEIIERVTKYAAEMRRRDPEEAPPHSGPSSAWFTPKELANSFSTAHPVLPLSIDFVLPLYVEPF